MAGALEWHGHHNPLGCDSLKAHAVCCEAALAFGGVVLPPIHQGYMNKDGEPDKNWGPEGWEGYTLGYNNLDLLEKTVARLAKALVAARWKVIVGVTGHDIDPQLAAMDRAIESAVKDSPSCGIALKEGQMHQPTEEIPFEMDHAGAWETSCMLYAYPDTVALSELSERNLAVDEVIDIDGPEGVEGPNPLTYASPQLGQKIIERMGFLIGGKAAQLLAEHQRGNP